MSGNPLYLHQDQLSQGLLHLFLSVRRLHELSSEKATRAGLDETDLLILMILEQKPNLALKGLCDLCVQSKQALSRHIRHLDQQGYLTAGQDAKDRRRKPLVLTAKGKLTVGEIAGCLREELKDHYKKKGDRAVFGFHQILESIVDDQNP